MPPDFPSYPAQFSDRLKRYAEATARFINQGPAPTTLLRAMTGNMGDHLIWRGTQRMLDWYRVPYAELDVRDVPDRTQGMIRGTLIVPGSAGFSTRWHEGLAAAVATAADVFERVVVLPSSYAPHVDVVARALASGNVYPIAREPHSYREIRRFGRAGLALDFALYAMDFRDFDSGEGCGTLLALRTDQESRLPGLALSPNAAINDDISLTSRSLDDFLDQVAKSAEIVTDRLQIAVASVILGRRLRFVDPYDRKISRYFDFSFRGEFRDRISQHDEAWLADRDYVLEAT